MKPADWIKITHGVLLGSAIVSAGFCLQAQSMATKAQATTTAALDQLDDARMALRSKEREAERDRETASNAYFDLLKEVHRLQKEAQPKPTEIH